MRCPLVSADAPPASYRFRNRGKGSARVCCRDTGRIEDKITKVKQCGVCKQEKETREVTYTVEGVEGAFHFFVCKECLPEVAKAVQFEDVDVHIVEWAQWRTVTIQVHMYPEAGTVEDREIKVRPWGYDIYGVRTWKLPIEVQR